MCPLARETHMEPGLHTSRESGGKSSTHLGAQIYYACPKNNSKSSGELSDDVLLIRDPESGMLETKQCRRKNHFCSTTLGQIVSPLVFSSATSSVTTMCLCLVFVVPRKRTGMRLAQGSLESLTREPWNQVVN